jgi:hypothetical protein
LELFEALAQRTKRRKTSYLDAAIPPHIADNQTHHGARPLPSPDIAEVSCAKVGAGRCPPAFAPALLPKTGPADVMLERLTIPMQEPHRHAPARADMHRRPRLLKAAARKPAEHLPCAIPAIGNPPESSIELRRTGTVPADATGNCPEDRHKPMKPF